MARRGTELREHILLAAKDVFLEMGFERTSMDVVAARAATSKRSLYAHFESKDKLFLAVVDLVRELYLGRLKTPGDYGEDTADAVVLFCGRFLQLLLWEPALRTCRLGIAEADRLPEASARYYDTFFDATHERLATFLTERYQLEAPGQHGPGPPTSRPHGLPAICPRPLRRRRGSSPTCRTKHQSPPTSISHQSERPSRHSCRPRRSTRHRARCR